MFGKHARVLLGAVIGVVLMMSISVVPAFANTTYTAASVSDQATLSVQVSKKFTGWKHTTKGWVYYNKGKKVVGLQKIDGKRYYFSSKGIMSEADVHVGGATFYVNSDGQIIGAKYDGTYYYDTLKPMTSDDSYDFDTLIWARSIVSSITNKGDSDETKLRKSFDWVVDKYYEIHRGFNKYETNWMATYARDHFSDSGGDCHSDAAAFAYLAAAIGYQVDVSIDGPAYEGHAWAMIGDKVFDPLFDESRGGGYYDAYTGTYEDGGGERYRVPTYSSKHNAGAAVNEDLLNAGKVGLKKAADGKYYYYQDGKKLKNAWKTIDGNRYYFKKDGAAATMSTKINGAYYVFDKKGVLQKSAKSGQRVIKLKDAKGVSNYYLVNQKGKAVSGWSKDKTRYASAKGILYTSAWKTISGKCYYFKKDGTCATGSTKVDGAYYVFDKKGVLQKGKTAASSGDTPAAKTALVIVGGNVYRVDKAGKAVASAEGEWLEGDMMRFDKTGMLLTGIRYTSKGFYAADSKGIYKPELTEQLNAASSKGSKASDLRRLLGAPEEEMYMRSCNFDGDDGLWVYEHFTVATERSADVNALYEKRGYHSIEDVIAAEDAAREASEGGSGEADGGASSKAGENADGAGNANVSEANSAGDSMDSDPYETISAIRAR